MRINEPIKTATGYIAKALPLAKWRRYYGLSSFLADMIALRKTLCLCYSCEHYKMPPRWTERYDYDLVRQFHAEACACDLCRELTSTSMYVAREGRFASQMRHEKAALDTIRRTERALREGDKKYLVKLSDANVERVGV